VLQIPGMAWLGVLQIPGMAWLGVLQIPGMAWLGVLQIPGMAWLGLGCFRCKAESIGVAAYARLAALPTRLTELKAAAGARGEAQQLTSLPDCGGVVQIRAGSGHPSTSQIPNT
jgi:hypothetical protein